MLEPVGASERSSLSYKYLREKKGMNGTRTPGAR